MLEIFNTYTLAVFFLLNKNNKKKKKKYYAEFAPYWIIIKALPGKSVKKEK
jgi:hypothetical protein